MGRLPKIKQIVSAEEYNKEGIVEENPATMIPQEVVDSAINQTKQKRGRKSIKKITVDDVLKEFEMKKQKLVDRYIKKVHKLMGI